MLTLWLVSVSLAPSARAITIIRVDGGGIAPGNIAGGGTLAGVFHAACDVWEQAILDPFTLTLTFRWGPEPGSTLASHTLLTQGGTPHRETTGLINVDNDDTFAFFLDPTPIVHTEWTTYTESFADLGGGILNTGHVYTGATGSAVGRFDLFSILLHEIGHALGLSSANTAFLAERGDNDVDVTAPRPFPGSAIPLDGGSAHTNAGALPDTLLFPGIGTGTRRLPTAADILANAQVSRFQNLNLNPTAAAAPEPFSGALLGTVGLAVTGAVFQRRLRR
jgi:hypothetical protein